MKKSQDKWRKTRIRGERTEEPRYSMMVSVLHRENADALRMACRMDREMAGCNRFEMDTEEAFTIYRIDEDDKRKEDIPVSGSAGENWDW